MTRKILLIPALAAALILPALAQGGASDRPTITDLDANGDGAITREEAQAPQLQRFTETDTNNDGAVSFEEMEAAHERRQAERRVKRFERMDANSDGVLSADEMTSARAGQRFDLSLIHI